MARPSFEVEPVRKISFTPAGIFRKMAAAVRVFPCTTRTLKSGCLSTNICPPPLSASFLFKAPRPITLVPLRSASRIARSICRLMCLNSDLMKNWNPHAGVTHVAVFRCSNRWRSAVNGLPKIRNNATNGTHSGRNGCSHHTLLNGLELNDRSANGRWNSESSSVPCATNTTSGDLFGAASPLMALRYNSSELGSLVPYATSYIGMKRQKFTCTLEWCREW